MLLLLLHCIISTEIYNLNIYTIEEKLLTEQQINNIFIYHVCVIIYNTQYFRAEEIYNQYFKRIDLKKQEFSYFELTYKLLLNNIHNHIESEIYENFIKAFDLSITQFINTKKIYIHAFEKKTLCNIKQDYKDLKYNKCEYFILRLIKNFIEIIFDNNALSLNYKRFFIYIVSYNNVGFYLNLRNDCNKEFLNLEKLKNITMDIEISIKKYVDAEDTILSHINYNSEKKLAVLLKILNSFMVNVCMEIIKPIQNTTLKRIRQLIKYAEYSDNILDSLEMIPYNVEELILNFSRTTSETSIIEKREKFQKLGAYFDYIYLEDTEQQILILKTFFYCIYDCNINDLHPLINIILNRVDGIYDSVYKIFCIPRKMNENSKIYIYKTIKK